MAGRLSDIGRRGGGALLAIGVAAVLAAACGGGGGTGSPTAASRPSAVMSPTLPSGTSTASTTPTATTARPVAGAYQAAAALPGVDFAEMLGLYVIPGDEAFAVLVSRDGMLRRISMEGTASPVVYLDLRDRLIENPGQEEGLLGFAFSPDFATSGRLYVYYTAGEPRRSVLSRVHGDARVADAPSEQVILEVPQPYPNHNGGQLAFGPDGYLYIGLGDGGSAGDPNGHGQDPSTLLGSILRIDVSGEGYSAPADNPFAGGGGAPEVWAYGLRNPWRFAFDPVTSDLWAADVGQSAFEEIDRIERGGNYGWNIMEGDACFRPPEGCATDGLIRPRAVYGRDDGCSVTGGYVYRGRALPELAGWFVYGDYCSGKVWAVNTSDDSAPVELVETGHPITSFGQDRNGELYVVTFDRAIFRLERR